jgi:hypothetical protein
MREEDRRRSTRYRINGSISFAGARVRGSGQIYNVSATGCAVGTPCDVPLGSQLRMSLHVGVNAPVVIHTAVVRWVRQYTFGVEFLLADTVQVTRLGACLEGLAKSE